MRIPARLLATIPLASLSAPGLLAQEALAPFDAPQVVFSSLTSVTSVGDFNADGDIDSLGWYWQSEGRFNKAVVRIFRNDGDSEFGNGWTTTVDTTGGQFTTWDTITGELNGSGADDFAFAFDQDVWVYVTEPMTFGTNTFYNVVELASWQESFAVEDLELADLDRDGLQDLVLIGAEVRAYRNTGEGFELMGSYPCSGSRLYADDFDGDGFKDLAVPIEGGVTMLRYRNDELQMIGNLEHDVQSFEGPMYVVGDIDNDADADVVVFTEGGEYVTMRCLAPEVFLIEDREFGGPATDLADIDGDGDLDGVCCGGGGPGPGRNDGPSTYHISINLGGGEFSPAHTIPGVGAFRLAGAVDMDHDGDLDLVAGRTILFNRGGFAVDPHPEVQGAVPMAPILTWDPDRDGDPDITAGAGTELRNDGAGNFTAATPRLPAPPPGTQWPREPYRGDFDGDGDTDLILTQEDTYGFIGMRLMWNTGGGTFVDGGYALPPGTSFVDRLPRHLWQRHHVVGDLDGDGDVDIVQGRVSKPWELYIWLNDGAGTFTHFRTYGTQDVPKHLVDLDDDGHLDLITNLGVWFGDGHLGFVRGPTFDGAIHPEIDHIAVGHINSDDDLDIAYLEWAGSGRLMVLLNQGNRVFHQQSRRNIYTRDEQPRGVDIAFLDADEHPDLVVWPGFWGNGELSVELLFGDGDGYFPRRTVQIVDMQGPLADVDGDGDLDAIGAAVTRGARFHAPRDGARQQYGTASTTDLGMSPTLGASGSLQPGGAFELSVTGVEGGTPVVLGIGLDRADIDGWPLPGLVGYFSSPILFAGLVADGTPGEPGAGSVRIPLNVVEVMTGLEVFLQAWAVDAASGPSVEYTNGLTLRFGEPRHVTPLGGGTSAPISR